MTSTKEQESRSSRHYTPRPWHIGMKPGPIIYGPNGEQVADMRGELLEPQEAAGNALLVCAAPSMLQALEEVVSMCEAYKGHPIHNDKRVTDARAVIAQAKGQA